MELFWLGKRQGTLVSDLPDLLSIHPQGFLKTPRGSPEHSLLTADLFPKSYDHDSHTNRKCAGCKDSSNLLMGEPAEWESQLQGLWEGPKSVKDRENAEKRLPS